MCSIVKIEIYLEIWDIFINLALRLREVFSQHYFPIFKHTGSGDGPDKLPAREAAKKGFGTG